MNRNKELEKALQWLLGMDYARAEDAISAYVMERDLVFAIDHNGLIVYGPRA